MIGSKGIIIEIGAGEVRGVLYTSFFGNAGIERTEAVPVDDNGTGAAVAKLLSSFPSDATITLQLPGRLFMVRNVSLPFTDRKKIRKTLPFEMDGLLPIPVDELLIDSVGSAFTEKGSMVTAVAIPKKTVADYLSLFPDGRKPDRVIPDLLSLASLGKRIKEDEKTFGVISFDKTATSMVLMSDGRPVLMRSTNPGEDAVPIKEWIGSTIKSHGDEVKKIYVTGNSTPDLEGLAGIAPLPTLLKGMEALKQPEWTPIAAGALTSADFPLFNILGLTAGSERVEKLVKTVSICTAILLALGTGDLYLRYRGASKELSMLKAETRKVFASAMPEVKKVVKEDSQLKDALNKGKELKEALVGKPSPSFSSALKGLEKIAESHSELKVKEVVMEGRSLTVSGDGTGITADGVKKVFSGLEGAKDALVEEMTQGITQNSYRFRVKVELK